ncbi:torsin-1A-interacting protein 2-like isoform X2 [Cololabis saira]|uniref:torsin-1A-interacting protein 2-like isoform X2 n=1 Tax=Cololabis saira TaxID=129043 RepID=UPI002AD3F375|nr:torsin-1A-interacting protein 2-like isoform X2 [Cololabis saira]
MDSKTSTNKGSGPLRRSQRQSSGKESPSKKIHLDTGGADDDGLSENQMDFEESTERMEKNENQELHIVKNSTHAIHLPNICKDALGDRNLSPSVVLGQRCRLSHLVIEDADRSKLNKEPKPPVSPTKSTLEVRAPELRHYKPITSSMAEYKKTMELKAKSLDLPKVNRFDTSVLASSEKTYTTRQRVNNIPAQNKPIHLKKQGTKKTVVTKGNPASSCRGFAWYLGVFVFLLLLGSATYMAYKIIPVLHRTANEARSPSRGVKIETFTDGLLLLKTQFPSQRPEFWKRSQIHLQKHIERAHPTEPVSMILTAGLKAEGTLRCLSHGLASSFSSALNASVLHIDGASKTSQESDKVKLDIDNQLQAAFEGDQPAAVIHRFEELPSGSTLIFYRYCDHENAAYKQVFLLFTVLLPQDELSHDLSLKEVEEIVQDYVKEKFVGSTSQTAFNEMDIDKFGGLWSRISHLILPVVSEEEVEHRGKHVCNI